MTVPVKDRDITELVPATAETKYPWGWWLILALTLIGLIVVIR